jgi:hypothetical protein
MLEIPQYPTLNYIKMQHGTGTKTDMKTSGTE